MARVKATGNYHGSNGYKTLGEEWEVSEDEAKQMIDAKHPVELVKEEKSTSTTKEEKTANPRKTK